MSPMPLEARDVQALGWTLLHFVWQGAQREARHHPHFFGSKLRLHTFENVGHKAVPERNNLLCLPGCGRLFRFELKALLILLLLLAEVNLARSVCAYLNKSAFLHAVCIDGRLEVVTEALFGSGLLPLLRFPRNDFDVVAARNNRRLSCDGVLFRNQDEIRHLLYTLSDVRVQFAVKARGVRTRIVLDLGEEECVESRALRAVGATSGLRQKPLIVFRKRH